MTEPITASTTLGVATGITLISILSGDAAPIVLGAFGGASLFVLVSQELTLKRRCVLWFCSLIAGCLFAPVFVAAMKKVIPLDVEISLGAGAFVASAIAIKVLLLLLKHLDDDGVLLRLFRWK